MAYFEHLPKINEKNNMNCIPCRDFFCFWNQLKIQI
jgi:hypothetical protein